MDIGENIRSFRREGGYTQKQLAGIIGVKASYISALERGQRRPGKKVLPLLCDALGVDEWAILFGTSEMYNSMVSPEKKALLAAIEGLPKDVIHELTQLIMKLKHQPNGLDSLLNLKFTISMRCSGEAYLATLEDECGRQKGKQLQM